VPVAGSTVNHDGDVMSASGGMRPLRTAFTAS
jgi:hypothetical protein